MSNTFYFAWVRPDQTTFDPATMNVEDEDIFSFNIKHDEGQLPALDLTIKNPREGLLNSGRKLWGWLSWQSESGIIPLFFGVVVGIPTNMFAELMTVQFLARPLDYIERKQTVAETLKVRPYYDPVFLDETHRDDPDAILEGWSVLYHVDRTTQEVTVSDILEGEDGTITFDETMGIYDSVQCVLGECPLDAVQVQAEVAWTQRYTGFMAGPSVYVQSYTGGSFKGDWPKPGASIGGGWTVEQSLVVDINGTEQAKSSSYSSNYTNNDPDAGDCAIASISMSVSGCNHPGFAIEGASQSQVGICDPGGIGIDGSEGVNIPAKTSSTGTIALLWSLNCFWNLRYDAKREFTELLVLDVGANLQATVTSPTSSQNTEVIKVSGANVGLPLVTVDAWSDHAGLSVSIATIIAPNDTPGPGGKSYQVCVVAGVAGTEPPVFSDVPGFVTVDGTVHWASLGESPPAIQTTWGDSTPTGLGTIIMYEPKIFSNDSGSFQTTGQSVFLLCTTGGHTNDQWVDFEYLPTLTSSDQNLPKPVNTSYIPGPGQGSPYIAPIFAAGAQVTDGTVQWTSLGTAPSYLGIPIGGTVEQVSARCYFPTDRGLWSVEYLVCKARARLRMRARCVKASWDAPFETVVGMSCRKNATVYDPRIPGGAATGKVISYELKADKDGKMIGHVEIGVAVGFGASVSAITGTPEYTPTTGYMATGYQQYDGGQYTLPEEDVAYTPPLFAPFDDGLSFPLQRFPGRVIMTVPDQISGVLAALRSIAFSIPSASGLRTSASGSIQPFTPSESIQYALECEPVACDILIHPLTNGPFNGTYAVQVTTLEVPQGINLYAGESP
jgi:hypothetical protein